MLTLSKPISASQAQAYHKSEFANAKENYCQRENPRLCPFNYPQLLLLVSVLMEQIRSQARYFSGSAAGIELLL
jgi:hypothetical protein